MMDTDDVLTTTVDELVENFRSAMVAMLPVAERVKLNWRDDNPHPDWERLAESLFDALVRGPINGARSRSSRELPLARYDIDRNDYAEVSWIAVGAASWNYAFVRLLSRATPFDTFQVVEVDPVTNTAGNRHSFRWPPEGLTFRRCSTDGLIDTVSQIEVIE